MSRRSKSVRQRRNALDHLVYEVKMLAGTLQALDSMPKEATIVMRNALTESFAIHAARSMGILLRRWEKFRYRTRTRLRRWLATFGDRNAGNIKGKIACR